jgi:hypothetical protein
MSVNAELAAAVRRVNALYVRVPEDRWPDVNAERWARLEARIDSALRLGQRTAALRAIEDWERHATRELTEVEKTRRVEQEAAHG